MKNFNIHLQGPGALPFSDTVNTLLLAGVNESATVPVGAKYVVINVSATTYFRKDATAAAATDVTDGTGSFIINPSDNLISRTFYVGDTAAINCFGTGTVSFSYYGA